MKSPFHDFPEARQALLALYGEVDALTHGFACDASTECCRFGVTGREPYPTAVELAEIFVALDARGRGQARRARRLHTVGQKDERVCPLLDADGRCSVYASRPFGCRTFFCARARSVVGEPAEIPRRELRRIGHAIADLSARFAPADPHPRPLSNALARR
jgi:Fe-S-cluster containining protein